MLFRLKTLFKEFNVEKSLLAICIINTFDAFIMSFWIFYGHPNTIDFIDVVGEEVFLSVKIAVVCLGCSILYKVRENVFIRRLVLFSLISYSAMFIFQSISLLRCLTQQSTINNSDFLTTTTFWVFFNMTLHISVKLDDVPATVQLLFPVVVISITSPSIFASRKACT